MTAKRMTTAEKIRNLQMMKTTGELPQEAENDSQAFTGTTYNAKGDKVKVTVPGRTEELSDDENPAFLFSGTSNSLLVQIVAGEIDANYMARVTLAARGLDKKGVWVGFKKATRIHDVL